MSYFAEQLQSRFTALRTLSRSDRGTVTLLRHSASGQWFVLRDYRSSAEPYRKLLGISLPHLSRVYEVAEEGGRVLELEEYIPGDTLAAVLAGGHTLPPREARTVGRQRPRAGAGERRADPGGGDLCQALPALYFGSGWERWCREFPRGGDRLHRGGIAPGRRCGNGSH